MTIEPDRPTTEEQTETRPSREAGGECGQGGPPLNQLIGRRYGPHSLSVKNLVSISDAGSSPAK